MPKDVAKRDETGPEGKLEISWREIRGRTDRLDRHFARSIKNAEATQRLLLKLLLRRNAASAFGREFSFSTIGSAEEFRARVPFGGYSVMEPYIHRCRAGESNVLACQPIKFAELTGGSSGSQKIIPYTLFGLEGFRRALWPWLADLLRQRPNLYGGSAYFAMSPVGRTAGEKIGELPLGSPTNFAYFGPLSPYLERISAVPPSIRFTKDFQSWQRHTCLGLLADENLSLIWVWSPTFLTELLREMHSGAAEMISALERLLHEKYSGDRERAERRLGVVSGALAKSTPDWEAIWPRLDTISCWTDASSQFFSHELQQNFPRVFIQPKGLMSTEAAVSFPYRGGMGAILAILSVFFEFIADDDTPRFAWQLEDGSTYRVIVTTASGLYRYDTGDVVMVVGRTESTPRLKFIGRSGAVSDLCGEKLTESFVTRALARTRLLPSTYVVVVPVSSSNPHYKIYIDGPPLGDDAQRVLAREIDAELCANPQYAYARQIGQLRDLRLQFVCDLYGHIKRFKMSDGVSLAGLKPASLINESQRDLIRHLESIE